MASTSYDRILDGLLESEGTYSNDPGDSGGPTKYGITIWDVRMYVNPHATASDVRALTLAQAKEIYRTKYWNKVKGDQLPAGVDYSVFDYGVNSGVVRAARKLQQFVGVEQDGKIGPITIAATLKQNPDKLIDQINDERMHFLQGLGIWRLFGRGWTSRVKRVRSFSHQLARETAK